MNLIPRLPLKILLKLLLNKYRISVDKYLYPELKCGGAGSNFNNYLFYGLIIRILPAEIYYKSYTKYNFDFFVKSEMRLPVLKILSVYYLE
jgi:hypothetical protein